MMLNNFINLIGLDISWIKQAGRGGIVGILGQVGPGGESFPCKKILRGLDSKKLLLSSVKRHGSSRDLKMI